MMIHLDKLQTEVFWKSDPELWAKQASCLQDSAKLSAETNLGLWAEVSLPPTHSTETSDDIKNEHK